MTELKTGQSWEVTIWGYPITNTKPTRSKAITEAIRQATKLFKNSHITKSSIQSVRKVSHIHEFEEFHTNGNLYEGGIIYRKCTCGTIQTASEDGTDTLSKYDSKVLFEILSICRKEEMKTTEEYQESIKRQRIQELNWCKAVFDVEPLKKPGN